jgi:hypothetical protein
VYRRPVLLIAVAGLVGSFLMNLATFAHYNPLNQFTTSVLFVGLFVVWFATGPAFRKLGFSPRQMQFAPVEVRFPALVLTGYLFFAFVTICLPLMKDGSKVEYIHGRIILPAEDSARLVTALLMVFYGIVAATQNAAKSP